MFKKRIKINKKNLLILILFFFLFFLIGCQPIRSWWSFLFSKEKITEIDKPIDLIIEPKETRISRFLDGILVEEDQENLLPVIVVLDNFPGAPRPSLVNASLIYEVPVEGGLTRYLGVFDLDNLPEKLGPIRSARPYFAELAEEYGALFVYAGGSPEALLKIKQGFYKIFKLDEIGWQGKYFWRSKEPAPHNLYIQKEQIRKFLDDQKIDQKTELANWQFIQETKKEKILSEELVIKAEKVRITFSPLSITDWRYHQEKNEYQLFKNNQLYRDKDGQEIGVKNLIVQYTKIIVLDNIGRRKIELDGNGQALVFQAGQMVEGQWLKEAGRTRFYNQLGEEITFLSGKTWISIISPTSLVNWE